SYRQWYQERFGIARGRMRPGRRAGYPSFLPGNRHALIQARLIDRLTDSPERIEPPLAALTLVEEMPNFPALIRNHVAGCAARDMQHPTGHGPEFPRVLLLPKPQQSILRDGYALRRVDQ